MTLQAEVNYLGQLSHPNLVKLIGYCLEDEQRLLVYEYMPRGSLEHHLFRSRLSLECFIRDIPPFLASRFMKKGLNAMVLQGARTSSRSHGTYA